MTRRDPTIPLRHMLDNARRAARIARGRSRADLDTDEVLGLALVRVVEVIGEAATRVTDEVRARFAAIPWQQIISTRNRLIHGYDTVNLDILWDIIANDLPPLVAELERGLEGLDAEQLPADTP